MKSTLRLFALACLAWSSLALARVDINTASSEELQTLKGIGAQRAEKIIQYRNQHGAFRSLDDLTQVPGLGDKIVDGLRKDALAGRGAKAAQPPLADTPVRPARTRISGASLPSANNESAAVQPPQAKTATGARPVSAGPALPPLAENKPARPEGVPAVPPLEKAAMPVPPKPLPAPATPVANRPAAPAIAPAAPALPRPALPATDASVPSSRAAAPAAPAKPAAPAVPGAVRPAAPSESHPARPAMPASPARPAMPHTSAHPPAAEEPAVKHEAKHEAAPHGLPPAPAKPRPAMPAGLH